MKQIEKADNKKLVNNPLREALDKCKPAFRVVFVFAFVINFLMLITPLYSLQVLDRVLRGESLSTLLMLSIIFAFIYLIYTKLQIARSFALIKIGEWLDTELSPLLFSHSISASATRAGTSSSQLLRDFQNLKTFLTSTGINTAFDAPWSIIYIIVLFLIHPYIGMITILGAVLVIGFAFFNAIATNKTLGEATELNIKGMGQAEIAGRNAETVEAMGMITNVSRNWAKFNNASLEKQSIASYRNGLLSNYSKLFRNIITMAVTGVGAYLVVSSQHTAMTAGAMIASSIIVGRALAPFDNAIVMWKSISSAMKSYKSLMQSLDNFQSRDEGMPIPEVSGHISVENVYYALPQKDQSQMPKYILKGISFSLNPGEVLAILGPSAAGKSTLAKLLVGVWPSSSGSIRLDGGDVFSWNRQNFGTHVGYLPQGIELFGGSIKQNIARMQDDSEIDPKKVIDAAKLCDAHEMILRLPNAYDTDIGNGGSNLSGGQRQRIGLARAFYGSPKFVVLDEPNANLDEAGELALANALKEAKQRGITVIVISHRPSILSEVDKVMVIQDGAVASFGSKDEVRERIKMLNNGTIHINDQSK